MNTLRRSIVRASLLALALTACNLDVSKPAEKTDDSTPPSGGAKAASTAGAKSGGTKIEPFTVVVDLPAGVKPNEIGNGFHSEDGAYYLMFKSPAGNDPKDMESAKKGAEEMFFKKWIKSEKTSDGWLLTWLGIGLDMQGKEYDNYNYALRRKIGGLEYECYGAVKKQDDLEKNLKLCRDIRPE